MEEKPGMWSSWSEAAWALALPVLVSVGLWALGWRLVVATFVGEP